MSTHTMSTRLEKPNKLAYIFVKLKTPPESNHFQENCVNLQKQGRVKRIVISNFRKLIIVLCLHQFLLSLLLQLQRINLQTEMNQNKHILLYNSFVNQSFQETGQKN